ncbi:MAG: hypothetical protein JSV65_08690 [Armatimonadota bacterium]|nr:MAG: hypothetical protein JSV65_08690 [Armatimonadota bacterium]
MAVALILAAVCAAGPASAYFLPSARALLSVPMAASPPEIDGVVDDACWREAAVAHQFILLGETRFARQQTRALLLWDEENLYLGFKCYEEHMDRLVTRSIERDEAEWRDDCVEILLQPPDDGTFYHLIATAGLMRYDAVNRPGSDADTEWNPAWELQTVWSDDRWEMEVSIPWTALGVQPEPGQQWRFNLAREEQPHSELSSYCPVPERFPDPAYFGTLALAESAPRITVESWGNPLASKRRLDVAIRNQLSRDVAASVTIAVHGPEGAHEEVRAVSAAPGVGARVIVPYEIKREGDLALVCTVTEGERTYFRQVLPISVPRIGGKLTDIDSLIAAVVDASGGASMDAGARQRFETALADARATRDRLAQAVESARAGEPGVMSEIDELTNRLDHELALLRLISNSYREPLPAEPGRPWQERTEYAPLREYYRAADEQGFLIWKADPWLDLDPHAVPEAANLSLAELKCARGERKYVALDLRNISSEMIHARVVPVGFGGAQATQPSVSVHVPVFIRRHVNTDEVVADPLPRINGASIIRIAPSETTQLFLIVETKGLEPGTHEAAIRIEPLYRFPAREVKIPVMIAPVELVEPPVRICTWGAILGISWATPDPLPYLDDAVAHGVNVFFVPPTFVLPRFDVEGNMVEPPDWTKHDEYVRAYSPHGLVVGAYSAGEYFTARMESVGVEFMSDAYKKAFRTWMTEWIAHLKSLGLGYDDFAFQLWDEPSGGKRYEQHVALGRFFKQEVDPNVHVVCTANFRDVEKLRAIDDGVDIWVPHRTTMRDPEAMAYIRATGEEIWCYVCSGYSKTLSPLAYYRLLPWEAFHHGARGWGHFAHMWWGEDVWGVHGPDLKEGATYSTIYPGREGPITCRRWEAYYEGRQDYAYLWMLRQAIERLGVAGADPAKLTGAQELLDRSVADALSLIGPTYPRAIAESADPADLDRARLQMLYVLTVLER